MRKLVSEYIADLKLITHNIHLFVLGGLMIGIVQASMSLLLNLYLKDAGFRETFIGRTLAFNSFGGVAAALPAAYLAARYKIKPILIASAVVVAASFFMMCHTGMQWLILTSAFVFGFSNQIRGIAAAPFIMRNTTEQERTLVFSVNYSTWMTAAIIGSIGGGYLHEVLQRAFAVSMPSLAANLQAYRTAVLITCLVGLLSIVAYSFIKAKAPAPDEVARAFNWNSIRSNWKLLLKLMTPYFLLGTGAGLIIPFLNLYFRDRFGLDAARIGVYFSLLSIAMIVAVMAVPVIKRKLGFVRTVVLTEVLSIPFMLILCFTENLDLAFWAFMLRGALMNMGSPVSTAFMMESVPEEQHGLVNSLASIAWAVSWALTAQIGGSMIEKGGYVPVFLVAIGLYILSAGSYYYFFACAERKSANRWMLDISCAR